MASYRKIRGVWRFRFIDADGKQSERKGCTGRRETEQMAAAAELQAAKIRAGLIDPRDVAIRDHAARPVAEHLADWHAALLARNGTVKHANQSRARVAALIDLAGVRRLADLTVGRIQAALTILRSREIALRTLHHYARNIKAFSKWLHRDGRTRDDRLAHLKPPANPETDRRHERRALTPGEAAALVRAAETGPTVSRLAGPDRANLYRLALGTGFRAAELASLTPESFDLAADQPTVTVQAGHSKRRRRDVQPIAPALAAILGPWLAGKPTGQALFPVRSYHTAEMVRIDLAAAGVAYADASGRVADFHALRHTYVSQLARGGASVKTVQSLARHSTPVLTLGTYVHLDVMDQSAALDALPNLTTGPRDEPETLAATGTEDRHMTARATLPQPYSAQGTVGELTACDGSADVIRSTSDQPPMIAETLQIQGSDASQRSLTGTETNGGGGIRTHGRFDPSTVFKTAPARDVKPIPIKGRRPASRAPTLPQPYSVPGDAPDLAEVAALWDRLPEAVRAGIVAMVRAASGSEGGR